MAGSCLVAKEYEGGGRLRVDALASWAVLNLPAVGAGPRQATLPPSDACLQGRRLLACALLTSSSVVRIRAEKKTSTPTPPIKMDFTLPVPE